jgi:hypothetical protein
MSQTFNPIALHDFIVRAKSATYVGDGKTVASCRTASHDLAYQEGPFSYLDSYFGGWDFIGEEVVYFDNQPVWAMNYYGRILHPDRITAAQAGQVIKASLSKMYKEGRFLGGFSYTHEGFRYEDTSQGEFIAFSGREWITAEGLTVYELLYHGGLIK